MDEEELKWLYSGALIMVAVATPLAIYCVNAYNWSTMLSAVLLNAGAAWLRHTAVVHRSFDHAFVSTILLGGAAAVVVSSFTVVPEAWFAPEERGLATSIAVQSNYAGWALGSFIPLAVKTPADMRSFTRRQAIGTMALLSFFLAGYRSRGQASLRAGARLEAEYGAAKPNRSRAANGVPMAIPLIQTPWWLAKGRRSERLLPVNGSPLSDRTSELYSEAAAPAAAAWRPGARASAGLMARNPRLLLHTAASALLGGVSFAIPAVLDIVLGESCATTPLALPAQRTMTANFAFIISGVVSGIVLGATCRDPARQHVIVFWCSLLCATVLSALLLLLTPRSVELLGADAAYGLIVAGMSLAGAGVRLTYYSDRCLIYVATLRVE